MCDPVVAEIHARLDHLEASSPASSPVKRPDTPPPPAITSRNGSSEPSWVPTTAIEAPDEEEVCDHQPSGICNKSIGNPNESVDQPAPGEELAQASPVRSNFLSELCAKAATVAAERAAKVPEPEAEPDPELVSRLGADWQQLDAEGLCTTVPDGAVRTGLVYDQRMALNHSNEKGHPECPERIEAIYERLESSGVVQRCIRLPCRLAQQDELESVHTVDHVAKMLSIGCMSDQARNKCAKGCVCDLLTCCSAPPLLLLTCWLLLCCC